MTPQQPIPQERKARARKAPLPIADLWENIWPLVEADLRREHGDLVVVPQPPEPNGSRRLLVYRAREYQPALPATRV